MAIFSSALKCPPMTSVMPMSEMVWPSQMS